MHVAAEIHIVKYAVTATALALLLAHAAGQSAVAQRAIAPAEETAAASSPGPTLRVTDWNKVTVFRHATDRCTEDDIPDAPPRAFRDDDGRVHLFATHQDNRALVGPDFDHLKHPCAVVYRGRHADAPQAFSDREWLTAFSTEDGRVIYALVHDEFQANLRQRLCPSGKYMACWENALTFALSTDGGASFHEPVAPKNLVASIPYRFQGEFGRPIGYFQPSNIVRMNGASYAMFHVEKFRAQAGGTCLMRSSSGGDSGGDSGGALARRDALDQPPVWRGWDGRGFSVAFEDPYVSDANPAGHVCAPVGDGSLFDFGSLTFDEGSGRFLAVTSVPHGSGNADTPPGVYVASSSDLVHWSTPSLIVSERELAARDPGANNFYGYFSLIDEASGARDFSMISRTNSRRPALALYYVELDQTHPPYERNLVKLRVSIQ